MPNKKDKTGADLKAFADSVSQKAAALSAIRSDNEMVLKAQQATRKLGELLHRSVYSMKDLEPEASDTFGAALSDFGKSLSDYISYGSSAFSNLSEEERDFYHKTVDLAGLLRNNDDKLKSVLDTLQFTSKFKADFAGDGKLESEAQFNRTGPVGHRPTLEECRNLSVEKSDPETVFDRMLWLQDQQFMASQTGQNVAPGFYQNTLNRLHEELETAPAKLRLQYAAMFQRHDVQLKEQANRAYEQHLQSAPAEQSAARKEDRALQQLSQDTSFLQVRAFASFRDSFKNTRMGDTIEHLSAGRNGSALADSATYPGYQLISGLAAGEMDSFLKGKNLFTQTDEANKSAMQQSVRASGVRVGSTMSKIGDLYQKLSDDKGRASPSFKAMRDAMAEVASIDNDNPDRRGEYLAAVEKARDMAQLYLDSHQGHRFTDSGKNRVEMAKEMKELMSRQYDRQLERQRAEDQQKANAIAEAIKGKSKPEALREISKLNKHIAPVRIVPKEPKFNSEVTKADELKGEIKHQLYNVSHGICAGLNLPGLWHYKRVAPIPKSRPTTELDLDRIPGRNGEKFKTFNPDDPKKGGADQKIMSDNRRPPMTWEKAIPEDPNQAPTITFEFDQGREGDPTAFPVVVKDGKKENEMGHGFVTLQYTKNNPLSGKPERYKVSFGFYPKGGFIGPSIMAAQVMQGMSVPGQLNSDNDHEVSTGLTYTVTNQQINRVLLAAQQYEKDGYNYFDRNCTTFVSDMSKVAGIDLSHVLKKVDLTSEGKNGEYAKLNTVGAFAMSHLAKRDVMKKVGRADQSYQRFGQKMLNKEDIVRVEEADKVFNKRMKGYTPGHATESARIAKNFKLHSTKYERQIKVAQKEGEKVDADELSIFQDQTKIRLEIGTLCASIIQRGEKDGLPAREMESAINRIMDYTDTMLKVVDYYAQKGICGIDPDKYNHPDPDDPDRENPRLFTREESKCTWPEQKKALFDGTATISEMIEGFNEIYRNTFKGDAELNVPFQHMVSMLEHCKGTFAQKYEDVLNKISYQSGYEKDHEWMNKMNYELNVERDSYQALRALRFGMFTINKKEDAKVETEPEKVEGEPEKTESEPEKTESEPEKTESEPEKTESEPEKTESEPEKAPEVKPIYYTPAQAAAMIQTFGSFEKGVEMFARRDLLEQKKNDGSITDAEIKELDSVIRENGVCQHFESAQISYAEERKFSFGDYSYAFIELPKGMSGVKTDDERLRPETVYQTLAMEKIFGGTKKVLKDSLVNSENEIESHKISSGGRSRKLVADPAVIEEQRENARLAVLRHLSDKMAANKAEMVKFNAVSIKKANVDLPYDPTRTKAADYEVQIAERAADFMAEKIADVYLKPVTEDVQAGLSQKLGNWLSLEDLVTPEDIRRLPEFIKLQKELDTDLGIQREHPEELDLDPRATEAARKAAEQKEAEEREAARKAEEEKKKAEEEKKKAEEEKKKAEEKKKKEANEDEKKSEAAQSSKKKKNKNKNRAGIPGLGGHS